MARRKYAEGEWFAVPLADDSYGLVLVARKSRRGIALGYFFGPRRTKVPAVEDVRSLRAKDAWAIKTFGDSAITQGDWLSVGSVPEWKREEWPMPVFRRREERYGTWFKVHYDEADLNTTVRETTAGPDEVEGLPDDGLLGSALAPEWLSRLLA